MRSKLDKIFDDNTVALTKTTETLPESASPALGDPGDDIEIVSYDTRVINTYEAKTAIKELMLEIGADCLIKHVNFIDADKFEQAVEEL